MAETLNNWLTQALKEDSKLKVASRMLSKVSPTKPQEETVSVVAVVSQTINWRGLYLTKPLPIQSNKAITFSRTLEPCPCIQISPYRCTRYFRSS